MTEKEKQGKERESLVCMDWLLENCTEQSLISQSCLIQEKLKVAALLNYTQAATRLGRPKFCPCFLWPLLALFSGRKTHCKLTRQRTHGSANTASVRSFRALKSLSCVPARHDRPITYHSNPYYYSGSQTLISEYAGAQRQGPWTPSRVGRF